MCQLYLNKMESVIDQARKLLSKTLTKFSYLEKYFLTNHSSEFRRRNLEVEMEAESTAGPEPFHRPCFFLCPAVLLKVYPPHPHYHTQLRVESVLPSSLEVPGGVLDTRNSF